MDTAFGTEPISRAKLMSAAVAFTMLFIASAIPEDRWPTSWPAFNYEIAEPLILGVVLLLVTFAPLIPTLVGICGAAFTQGLGGVAFVMRAVMADGVVEPLKSALASVMAWFRGTWVYRGYRWLASHLVVILLCLVPMLLISYFRFGEAIYAFLEGLEEGFNNPLGAQAGLCKQDPERAGSPFVIWPPDPFLGEYCGGEWVGVYARFAWDTFLEDQISNLYFLAHISKFVGTLAAVGMVIACGISLPEVFEYLATQAGVIPSDTAQESSEDGVSENTSDSTGTDEKNHQQLEPHGHTTPAGPASLPLDGAAIEEFNKLREKVQDLIRSKDLAIANVSSEKEKVRGFSRALFETKNSLLKARKQIDREVSARLHATERYYAFRRLAEKTADESILAYFGEFEGRFGGQKDGSNELSGTDILLQSRKAVDVNLPAFIERAVATRDSEKKKAAEYTGLLEDQVEDERSRSNLLEQQLAEATRRNKELTLRETSYLFQREEWKQRFEKLEEEHAKALWVSKEEYAQVSREKESEIEARDQEILELKERNEDLVQEVICSAGGSRKMRQDLKARHSPEGQDTPVTLQSLKEQLAESDDREATLKAQLDRVKQQLETVSQRAATQGSLEQQLRESAAREKDLKAQLEANSEKAATQESLEQRLSESADREGGLKAQLDQVQQQLADITSERTATQETLEAQLAGAASREGVLREQLDQANGALAESQLQMAGLEERARAYTSEQVRTYKAQAAEHQTEILGLKEKREELQRELKLAKKTKFDDKALQDSRIEVARMGNEIEDLKKRLLQASGTSADDRAKEEVERLRKRLKEQESQVQELTNVRVELARKVTAAEQEARKAKIDLSNSGSKTSQAGLVVPKKKIVNPLQQKVDDLARELRDTKSKLAEMTSAWEEAKSGLEEMTRARDEAQSELAQLAESSDEEDPSYPPPLEGMVPGTQKRRAVSAAEGDVPREAKRQKQPESSQGEEEAMEDSSSPSVEE